MTSTALPLSCLALMLVVSAAPPARALSTGSCPDEATLVEAVGLRLSADPAAPAIAFARAGERVQLRSCEGDWAEVDAGSSGHGWVRLERLEGAETRPRLASISEPADRSRRAPKPSEPWPAEGSVEPRRPLLLREEPRWGSAVAGRSPAGTAVRVLSDSDLGWSLVEAGLDRPAWVVTAALHAPPLTARR